MMKFSVWFLDELILKELVTAFKLKESRPEGKLPVDRSQFIEDNDKSTILDPEEDIEDLYPFQVVNEDGVIGSCSTYKTRKKIVVSQSSVVSQKKMGGDENSVVFVASQTEREKALLGSYYDPLLVRTFAPMAFAILERIGRAR